MDQIHALCVIIICILLLPHMSSEWFRYVPPNEEDPPPPPPELKEWAQGTAYGMLFGMAYGAYVNSPTTSSEQQQAVKSSSSNSSSSSSSSNNNMNKTTSSSSATATPLLNSKHRVERVIRGITMHGVRIGSFASCFTAVRLYSKATRDIDDYLNYVFAGGLTSGLTGLAIPGSRAKGLLYGVVFGSGVCLPIGYMMEESNKWMVENGLQSSHQEKRQEYEKLKQSVGKKREDDVTMKVIERMERELNENVDGRGEERWWKFWRRRGA